MRVYYWNNVPNFGDAISPLLLKKFASIDAQWAPFETADVIVSGSVIHHIPPEWYGSVIGAGLLRPDLPRKFTSATDFLAVRGPLTAKLISRYLTSSVVIADAGLLADELLPISPSKKYDLGILPHWTDEALAFDPRFKLDPKYTIKVISPSDDPLHVIRQIGECHKLVTSSLHGLIVADAFGVPRRFETTPLFDLDTLFKFEDYSASIGLPLKVGVVQQPVMGLVEERKHELYDVFEAL